MSLQIGSGCRAFHGARDGVSFFIHCDVDKLAAYDMIEALYAACPSAGKEQYTAQGFPHGVVYQDKNDFPMVVAFADRWVSS